MAVGVARVQGPGPGGEGTRGHNVQSQGQGGEGKKGMMGRRRGGVGARGRGGEGSRNGDPVRNNPAEREAGGEGACHAPRMGAGWAGAVSSGRDRRRRAPSQGRPHLALRSRSASPLPRSSSASAGISRWSKLSSSAEKVRGVDRVSDVMNLVTRTPKKLLGCRRWRSSWPSFRRTTGCASG